MTQGFQREEHLHFDHDVYEDWMEIIASPQHLQHQL
jgi:hypothetical protein